MKQREPAAVHVCVCVHECALISKGGWPVVKSITLLIKPIAVTTYAVLFVIHTNKELLGM